MLPETIKQEIESFTKSFEQKMKDFREENNLSLEEFKEDYEAWITDISNISRERFHRIYFLINSSTGEIIFQEPLLLKIKKEDLE